MGQPTITSQVKALERHFDVELFHRRGRRVELTEEGGNLFRISQRIIRLEAEAEEPPNEPSTEPSDTSDLPPIKPNADGWTPTDSDVPF